MSYVMAVPQSMDAAATDLAAIGSAVNEAQAAAATRTNTLLPAAADEVSTGIAQLFSQHADDYQKLAGQAAAFHGQFMQQLTASANAYSSAEAANASLLQSNASSAAPAATTYINLTLEQFIFFFFLWPFWLPIAASWLPFYLLLSAFFPETYPPDGFFNFLFSSFFS